MWCQEARPWEGDSGFRGVGAEPHNHEGQQLLALLGGRVGQGGDLKTLVDALPQPLGVLHLLQEEAILLDAGDIEGVSHGTDLRQPCR